MTHFPRTHSLLLVRATIMTLLATLPSASAQAADRQAVANQPQSAPSSANLTLTATLEGSRVAVFDTKRDSCELIDIPDAPARAFRDDKGMVHMVSSHYRMRQSVGPTLATVKHRCEIAYDSHHDPNPADWDDNTWVDSFFSIDGKNVVGLGHMEYHGWEHPGECFEQGNYSSECWYNGDTFHMSHDGGYHFNSFRPPITSSAFHSRTW